MSSSTATILEQLGFGFPTPHALYLALGAFTTSYLLLVRSLRYRRVRQLPKQFGYDNLSEAEIYEKITLQDAQDINKVVESFEFPFSYNTSLQFALFRVSLTSSCYIPLLTAVPLPSDYADWGLSRPTRSLPSPAFSAGLANFQPPPAPAAATSTPSS